MSDREIIGAIFGGVLLIVAIAVAFTIWPPALAPSVHRTKVPQGWVVTTSGGVTYVPDPQHEWEAP